MLTYLTSYLCKPEDTVSELMQKDVEGKMLSIGNIFLTKREVSTHEAIKSIVFIDEAFKYRCSVCSYWSKKE